MRCGDRSGGADAAADGTAGDGSTGDGAVGDAASPDGATGDGAVLPDSGTDAEAPCVDTDGDGYGTGCVAGPDCDDSTALVRPGRDEIPFNGVDDDCEAATPDSLVFDLPRIADAATAQCTFSNPRQVLEGLTLMDLWDVSYWSWESIGGELSPILIRGYAAKPAATIEDRASLRAAGAQRAWFRHRFGTDSVYATLPASPAVPTLTPSDDAATCWAACNIVAPCLYVAAPVDPGTASLEVERVWFWWSNDSGLLWGSVELSYSSGIGAYDGCFTLAFDPGSTAYYLDVQYVTPVPVRLPQEWFSLSSAVTLPAGFVPSIRRQDTCWYP